MSTKNTIFQKLDNIIFSPNRHMAEKTILKGNNEIIRTHSKEDAEIALLQAQQNKYLNKQWIKSEGYTYQKAIHYEATRIGSYSDFEKMEFFPEIASALDIYMEEATVSRDGKVLNINSESSRIKQVLEDLFYNRLKIQANLPMWTRNVTKYGDNFLIMRVNAGEGVLEAKQAPNYEIQRVEGDFMASINGDEDASKTTFHWLQQNLKFNEWQVAHFRLLGDDRKLPYGTSILEKVRRIYKQLILAEDAMLVYRVTRAPERRVYKINVGNIDDKDVPAYINDIANRFKRSPIVDSQTGNIDVRYNTASNDQDFFIPVRSDDAPNPIDTLPGASNLDAIADIEYLQNKLCIALRVPKTFLGFSEAVGEGKNLSLMDIRFSRSVNRVQQSMIQELNKIAIIHLYLLGFEEDLGNFTLSLNNPSSASEMLEIDQMITKADAYIKLVSDAGNGFAIMSRRRAMKEVFKWSDEEMMADYLEQRMEKAGASELDATSKIIKHTGIFDKVDRIYGDLESAKNGGGTSDESGSGSGGSSSSSGGGFGGFDDLDDSDFDDLDDEFGDIEAEMTDDVDMDVGTDDSETLDERIRNKRSRLIESRQRLINNKRAKILKYQNIHMNNLTESLKEKKPKEKNIIKNIQDTVLNNIDDLLTKY